MITIDITLLIHIINMILLMVALNAVLYKPILGILEKRAERQAALQAEALRFQQDAQSQQAELDRQLQEAGAKAKKALDEARAKALATGAQDVATCRAEAEADKKKALASVQAESDGARKTLQDNTAEFAQAMAEKILGRSLNA